MPPRHQNGNIWGERFRVKGVFDVKNGIFGNEKHPGWLGRIGDYTHLCGDYNKPLPIGSMGLVYLPTFTRKINHSWIGKYTIHGWYAVCSIRHQAAWNRPGHGSR